MVSSIIIYKILHFDLHPYAQGAALTEEAVNTAAFHGNLPALHWLHRQPREAWRDGEPRWTEVRRCRLTSA